MRATRVITAVLVLSIGCSAPVSEDAGADATLRIDGGDPHDAATGEDGGIDAAILDAASPVDAGVDGGPIAGGAISVDASATEIVLSDVGVYSNCMPIVAPDPIIAFWNVTITGAPGSAATLTSAKLTITGSSTVIQTLVVDEPVIALSGGAGSGMQRKTGADSNPSAGCGELCGGATYVLELTYEVGGASIDVTETGSFGCVY
jgi:hypothetical protein